MDTPLIRVEGLYKRYETAVETPPVLKDVNLSIGTGDFVAIMGPSGSGKSTFMNILGCLDTPSAGAYYLEGRDVAHLSGNELAHLRNRLIGFVFQGFNLLSRVTALDNAALPLLYAGAGKAERRERALALLKETGLEKFARSEEHTSELQSPKDLV